MKSFPLPKSSLLTKKWEYDRVYRTGKRLRGRHLSLIYTPGEKAGTRLGISVHGRIKGAVKRNRIKRIIREFYRLNRDFSLAPLRGDTPPGIVGPRKNPAMDIVITVHKGFVLDTPAEIKQAISFLTGKEKNAHR